MRLLVEKIISRRTVGALGVLLFLFLFQIRYASTLLYPPAIAASALLMLFAIDYKRVNFKWLPAVIVFAIYTILSSILYATKGDDFARTLPATHLLNFLALLFFASQSNSQSFKRFFINALAVLAMLESSIIILQSTYVAYGFGMPARYQFLPNVAESQLYLFASYGNPNNSGVVIAMIIMVLLLNKSARPNRLLFAFVLILAGLAIFFTLSRAALLFYVLSTFLLLLEKLPSKKLIFALPLAIVISLFAALPFNLSDQQSPVFEYSLSRINKLQYILSSDESVDFRIISHQRLFENLPNLGLGTFTDIQYSKFYKSTDPFVAKFNPHSFIAESSFLYGFPGLALAVSVVVIIASAALSKSVFLPVRLLFVLGFLVFQSVPSSIFGIDQILFIFIAGSLL
jgi:hypothetical protein